MNTDIEKLELKIQSMKQRFADNVVKYEDEVNDIRVEATMLVKRYDAEIASLNAQITELRNKTDVVESEVIED